MLPQNFPIKLSSIKFIIFGFIYFYSEISSKKLYIKDPQPKRKNSYLRKLEDEERSEMKIIKINTKMKKITVIKTSSTTAVDLQHLKVKG